MKKLKQFLEHDKFDPNVQDGNGNTALHISQQKGYKLCVIALLKDKRTNAFIKNNKNEMIIQMTRDKQILRAIAGEEDNSI